MSSTCVLSPTTISSASDKFVFGGSSAKMATSGPHPASMESASSARLPSIHPALRSSNITTTNGLGNLGLNNSSTYSDDYYQSSNEIIHDSVTLLSGNKGPTRVILSVFRTTVDHFALVYPDNRLVYNN